MTNGAIRRWDRLLAAVLALGFLRLLVSSVFSRRDWNDIVAYGLPGANLVLHGRLALPQLGSQMGLDRYWLFNAPFMALGCVPAFLAGGVGRVPYLLGIVALGLANLAIVSALCRRLFGVRSWTVAIWIAFAFLATRGMATAELYNQNYGVAALPALLLAFMPGAEGARQRWWQWLLAASLPLVHLVLAPASLVWMVVAGWQWRHEAPEKRSLAGPAAFAAGAAADVAWYARLEPFQTQLWPHISYGGFRFKGPLSGFLEAAASPIASVPSWILNALVLFAAVVVMANAVRTARTGAGSSHIAKAGLPAALLILALLPLDVGRGWLYYSFFLVGLGPIVMAAAADLYSRRAVVAVLSAIAALNVVVSFRLDREPPDWTTTGAADQFVLAHTGPTDRILLGPPFVFSTATLPPARDVRRIVPEPYFLEPFDEAAWRAELDRCCDLYLGEEEFFREPVTRRQPGSPLFAHAEVQRLEFLGEPVVLARKVGSTPSLRP